MDTEKTILDAAAALLEAQGPASLTTRAVCEAAGIKSPTLYHHFGDKDGLERALIQRELAEFMRRKKAPAVSADPMEQLRFGWDVAIEFALNRPALYALFTHHVRMQPDLLAESYGLMQARVQRLVDMGRLRGPVEAASRVVWAASQGALSLVLQGVARKEVESTSALLFAAVIRELTGQAAS